MKYIAVYGSLKKGKYNHSILSDSKFMGDTTVKGTLYRVSSYPALVNEGDTEYDAEVYQVNDDVYNSIRNMELGAGYKEVECLCYIGDVVYVEAVVYYADTRLAESCKENKEIISSY